MSQSKRATGISVAVFRHFIKNSNVDITIDDLVAETGFGAQQIRNAISNLRATRRSLREDLMVLITGQVWRYAPRPGSNPVLPDENRKRSDTEDLDTTRIRIPVEKAALLKSEKRLFEEVADAGEFLLLKSEDGAFFRATPLA